MIEYFHQHFVPILLVLLFFCGSILVHELGHYIAAKRCNLFVPRFSIGFGPKLFGFRYQETEFVVSLLPLGGYVAIPQLADLSEIEGTYDLPKNLVNASCLDKVIVAVCGPLMNILFALFLATIVHFIGLPSTQRSAGTTIGYVPQYIEMPSGDQITSPAYKAGLRPCDVILSIDGTAVHKFDEISQYIALGSKKRVDGQPLALVKINRGGSIFDIEVTPVILGEGDNKVRTLGILPEQKLITSECLPNTQAATSGLQNGDIIISANGERIYHSAALHDMAKSCDYITLDIERAGNNLTIDVPITQVPTTKPYLTLRSLGHSIDIVENTSENNQYKIFFEKNDLKKFNGCTITSLDNNLPKSLDELQRIISSTSRHNINLKTPNGSTSLDVIEVSNVKKIDSEHESLIGIRFEMPQIINHPGIFEQVRDTALSTFKTLNSLFNKNSNISARHLMGPVGMVRTLHSLAKFNVAWLLWFVILINVNLAILNLLPLPVLDGGQIVISLLEKIAPRKYLSKVLAILQYLFMVLLLGLIIYVTFFDFRRMWNDTHHDFEATRRERIAIDYEN